MVKGTLTTYCPHCKKMLKVIRTYNPDNKSFKYQCPECKNKLFADLLKND